MTLCDGLGILFIGLKLTGHIEWSWGLVLMPIYGEIIITAIWKAVHNE